MATCAKNENLLTIASWGNGAPELTISAPSGYTVEKRKGPDFDIHYIRSKNTGAPLMGIYVGHYPDTFSSQRKEGKTATEPAVILGQSVEWMSWQEKEEGKTSYHCETVISNVFKGNGGVADLKLHIFVEGPDEKGVNALKTAAKSLRIINR